MGEILFIISQMFIVIFGVGAMYLISRKDKLQKYGFLLGLISQPFWFYAVIYGEQWGMFIINIFYLYTWIMGFKNHYLK